MEITIIISILHMKKLRHRERLSKTSKVTQLENSSDASPSGSLPPGHTRAHLLSFPGSEGVIGTASLQKLMGWGVETVWSLSLQGHQDRTLSSSTVHRMINIDFQVNSSSESSQRQFPVTATSSPLHCLWTRSSSPALLLQPFHWPVSLTPNSSPPIQLLCYPVMSFLKFSYFFLLTRLWIKSNFRTSN